MKDANNALPWIIFFRDRRCFEKKLPFLKVRRVRHHTFLRYYASGGLSHRPFIPGMLYPVVQLVDMLALTVVRKLGSMMTIEVERV